MRKIFTLLFCSLIILLSALIINFIPFQWVENKVIKIAQKQDITIYSKSKWTIRLLGFKATTENFAYETKIGKNKLSGYGENFVLSLINDSINIENLSIDIYLEDGENISNMLELIAKKMAPIEYNIYIKNLFINIYVKSYFSEVSKENTAQQATNNTQEEGIYKLTNEMLLNNIEMVKNNNKLRYSTSIGINKDNKSVILLTVDDINNEDHRELNGKIESNNFYCYVYNTKKGGKINCEAKKLLSALKDTGIDSSHFEDNFCPKLLDKKIIIKTDIINDIREIKGKIIINNDIGDINYKHTNHVLNIAFNKLDMDKTTSDVEDGNNHSQSNDDIINNVKIPQGSQAMFMSGKENKIISSIKKKDSFENVNSFGKVINLIISLLNNTHFKSNILIKEAKIAEIPVNIVANISKTEGKNVEITALKANFGANFTDSIIFKQQLASSSSTNNSSNKNNNNLTDNFVIFGKDVNNLRKLLNLKLLNPNINSTNYGISGNLSIATNRLSLNNINLYVDEQNILNFSFSKEYSVEKKNTTTTKKVNIQNIDLNKYYDINSIYKKYYDAFLDFQSLEYQDAIFLKKLFEKRKNDTISDYNKQTYIFNNIVFEGKKIENFACEYKDNKKFTTIHINSKSDIFDGKFNFDIRNINEKETIATEIDAKMINFSQLNTIFSSFETVAKSTLKDIFYKDDDYNLPSLIGLHGETKINIDSLITINNKLYNNINGSLNMNDGIIKSNNFTFRYKDGDVVANMVLAMQGRPDLKLGFSVSGININDIIQSPLNGYVSLQFNCKTYGFNPVQFIKKINGKGKFVIQNIKIPHFDLLNTSNEIIKHGIGQDVDYYGMILNKPLLFNIGEGNLFLENGIVKGNISLSRELVSGSANFEYNLYSKTLNKLASSFAMMMVRKRFETPFPIYITIACSGKVVSPECLFNWEQLKSLVR